MHIYLEVGGVRTRTQSYTQINMPILESVAQNIESALAYTIADKVVGIIKQMALPALPPSTDSKQWQGQQASPQGQSTLMLCTLLLLLFTASEFAPVPSLLAKVRNTGTRNSAHERNNHVKCKDKRDAETASTDVLSMLSHIGLLAMSKIAMQQVDVSGFEIDPLSSGNSAAFRYVRAVSEIMFLGISASCILVAATFYMGIGISDLVHAQGPKKPAAASMHSNSLQSDSSSFPSTFLGSQVDSLMVNLQRTFAEAIGNLIPDSEARRMMVFLGMCMLPATASVQHMGTLASEGDNLSKLENFFLVFEQKRRSRNSRLQSKSLDGSLSPSLLWRTYAGLITKIWVTGISMAWINTTLGFILPPKPSSSSRQQTAFSVTINLVASVCLAFLTKALNGTFTGLTVFQNYIEWNVATTSVAYIDIISASDRGQLRTSHSAVSVPVTPLIIGLAFYGVNEIIVTSKKSSSSHSESVLTAQGIFRRAADDSLRTFHSILLIMFTNSLVSYSMQLISPPQMSTVHGTTPEGYFASLASVVAGMVVARTLMGVVHRCLSED